MKEQKLNILLITSDQQHWNTLGCVNKEIQTPNLDKLANGGTLFTRAYCSNPTCTPSRSSIITGKYPSQHGAWALGTKLPESEATLGNYLQKGGYRTSLVGKAHFQPTKSTDEFKSIESIPELWDLKFWKKFHGPYYGFEHLELVRNHVDEHLVGAHYAIWLEENGLENWKDYYRPPIGNNPDQIRTWFIPEKYHYDTWIAERTVALLEEYRKNNESFFLWASFPDPHPKYLVPEPWDKMYDLEKLTVPSVVPGEHKNNPPHFQLAQQENPDFSPWRETGQTMHGFHSHLIDKKELVKNIAVYYGMISLMDKHIGKILNKLDVLGLTDNTLVIFTTDHGHLYGQHGLIAKGAFHYEDLLKIPLIIRYPGKVPAGRRCSSLQSLVDFAPSFLNICGLPVPRMMTGVDQSEVWFGKKEKNREHVIVENRHEPTTIHLKTYVDERYKITIYYNREYGELFDLKDDPGEINNLWAKKEYAELKHNLVMKLLFAEMEKEPLWMPRTSGA